MSALFLAEFGSHRHLCARRHGELECGCQRLDELGSVDDDGWEPTYGVGIGAHFGSLGLRAEYEQFSTDAVRRFSDSDISTISLSFTYTFL